MKSGENFSPAFGEGATDALLMSTDRPTAIIAGSNQILIGVLRSLRAHGVSIPDGMSLVTCDDLPLSEFLQPPLATISRDHEAMGRHAAELLLDMIDHGETRQMTLPTQFRATASCSPPPSS